MNISEQIIDKIKRNRISTTEIADCMNKSGNLPNVYTLNKGHFRVGRVFWAYAYNESNWGCHEQLRDVQEDQVVVVETFNCNQRAIFGSLVSKFLMLYRQACAIVVCGHMRDAPHLIKENWPIWLEGITPIGCFNKKNGKPSDKKIKEKRKYFDGAVAVCDDSGVIIIPKKYHVKTFLDKLDLIEEQEDIWFDCIDRLKWDTFETVCLKKYKNNK
ncbi:MAG: RraA family protein [Thermodesulfobacteriota bacterium]|jgi:regulator of RNase E activity RraA